MGARHKSIAETGTASNTDTVKIDMISDSKPIAESKRERLKKILIPLLTILLVIAITVGLFFYGRDPARIAELKNYGYFGAFLISLIGNATILLPVAVLPILTAIGIVLYPVTGPAGPIIVGLVGGIGAGIGEIVGYMAGYSGRGVLGNKKFYLRLVEWMKKWGILAIFILAMFPFFFDVAGIAAGILRFPLWKFILACWLGRTINYVVFASLVAAWGWKIILPYLGWP